MRRPVLVLAFDATVTGEVTITTSLGWDTGLVRTFRIDAGLYRPVAIIASKVGAIQEDVAKASFHGGVIQTFQTSNKIATPPGA